MDGWLLSFIGACISSLLWTALPTPLTTTICLTFSLLLLLRFSDYPFAKCISGFLAGLVWISSVGHWHQHWQLREQDFHQSIIVTGEIESLIASLSTEQRFMMRIDSIDDVETRHAPIKFRLSWYQPNWELKQGQEVKFLVKVKPAHGLANEGGFNYQQWLMTQGVKATGYVKKSELNALIDASTTIRQQLLDQLLSLELSHGKWLAALSLGYRGFLDDDDWAVLQQTGTAHLVAISGLHIGVVATASYWVFNSLLMALIKFGVLSLNTPSQRVSIFLTLLLSLFYAYLAGFSLPTLRACLMLFVVSILLWFGRSWSPVRSLLAILFVVILSTPFSLYGISLWLSLSAVGIILFAVWCWPVKRRSNTVLNTLGASLRLQLVISLFMLPIVAWQFGFISLGAPIINFIAVPLVTLILVPTCLAATFFFLFFPSLGQVLFKLADTLIGFCVTTLYQVGSISMTHVTIKDFPFSIWLCLGVGLLGLLLPKLPIPKFIFVIWILPFIAFIPDKDKPYWQVDVLDVGQGLAVLISSNNKVILYDTGPSFPSGFNMADAVILPLLRSRGINKLDLLIVSHNDNDHAGGVSHLEKHLEISNKITSEDLCFNGWRDERAGLKLAALWPLKPMVADENESSCVVKASGGLHSILLSGDIDKSIERRLIEMHGEDLKSTILVAPHHGSNSSSSETFIKYVDPTYSIFSQGYLNRWSFPKAEVVERYHSHGVKTYSTSEHGQITFKISPYTIEVQGYRRDIYPFWYANYKG
ncbi:DNA internalization-related competence protein ComEC/Rec2 [Alteromonadaceae bacterium M269]|nr:DNA internalization-related competence protein ComEC/Rec2 [Alteromonadaceae bacterium M269]